MSIRDTLADKVELSRSAAGSAVAALATASLAPVSGKRLIITHVSASYSAATIGLLQIKDGTVVIWEHYIHNSGEIDLGDDGIQSSADNQAMSAELAAGAAGVTGKVNVRGYATSFTG